MTKLLPISRSKYRVVISDVLPYERPVFFSNRFFARLLKYYGVRVAGDELVATKHKSDKGLAQFLQLLGGKKGDERPCFLYRISKNNEEEGRRLAVIHPFHQVKMVELYEKYRHLFIYFCNRSRFSIRFPNEVASFKNKQKGYHKLFSEEGSEVDASESFRNFFTYKHYKNINQFFDDYRFLRAEKKFAHMIKMDVEKCFDSIRPMFLQKALYGEPVGWRDGDLASDFSQLQMSFRGEGEGIVIGPEFSRIYAEMVMQAIDLNIEKNMKGKGWMVGKDYMFYRYVDDGFFFYNDSNVEKDFMTAYRSSLGEYLLGVNQKKIERYDVRPFLSALTTAKGLLWKLVDEKFQNRLETFKGYVKLQNQKFDTPTHVESKFFIREMRTIMGSFGQSVKYKDVTASLLGFLQKKTIALLRGFNNLYRQYVEAWKSGDINNTGRQIKEKYEREFIDFAKNVVEILFFVLSCDLRMSCSIKVVSIINKLQLFVRGKYIFEELGRSDKFPYHFISALDEKISDEIRRLLKSVKPARYNLMEVLNVLEVEKTMSTDCRLDPQVLTDFITKTDDVKKCLNFFTVFEMLHFVKDQVGYKAIREMCHSWIDAEVEKLTVKGRSDSEAVLTVLETLCCPWIDEPQKQRYAQMLFGEEAADVCCFTNKQKDLFVRWRGYSLYEELMNVNSPEVY